MARWIRRTIGEAPKLTPEEARRFEEAQEKRDGKMLKALKKNGWSQEDIEDEEARRDYMRYLWHGACTCSRSRSDWTRREEFDRMLFETAYRKLTGKAFVPDRDGYPGRILDNWESNYGFIGDDGKVSEGGLRTFFLAAKGARSWTEVEARFMCMYTDNGRAIFRAWKEAQEEDREEAGQSNIIKMA